VKVKSRRRPEPGDDKQIDVLGRIVRCAEERYEYEVDPKHCQKIMEALGFDDKTKGLAMNGRVEEEFGEVVELQVPEATSFRTVAARLKHVSQDALDFHFAAKEVCREMAGPTEHF
jgi:hypothetical protein